MCFRALYPTPSPRGGCPNTTKPKNHTQNLELHSSDKDEGSQDMDDLGTEEMEDYELNRALLNGKKNEFKQIFLYALNLEILNFKFYFLI